MRFEDILRSDVVLDGLYDMHFDECTPIQEQAIPIILKGRDLIGIAQTGTGKTAAYLLPVIDKLAEEGYPTDTINCLIIAPTRELVQQIDRQMEGFSYYMPVSSVAVYGGGEGEDYRRQRDGLRKGADMVIATPGRLLSHLSVENVDLSHVAFLILDEADRMLDMGFYDDIMRIVSHLPQKRQTLLFSATMPPKIQQLARRLLHNPAEIRIAPSKPADKIRQQCVLCDEARKQEILRTLLAEEEVKKTIIFASSKQKVKELGLDLRRRLKSIDGHQVNVGLMHSDLEQSEREETMLNFRSGKINLLVATDIVARGIDIDDIMVVVNYDLPHDPEDYVHRVGRTARADRDGRAVTFVSPRETGRLRSLERFLGKPIERIATEYSAEDNTQQNQSAQEKTKYKRHGHNNRRNAQHKNNQRKHYGHRRPGAQNSSQQE